MVREDKSKQPTPACQQRVRIFLGEDDNEMRDLLAGFLRQHGHEVIEAVNGLELLREIQAHEVREACSPLNLVVTDVSMPEVSGLDVLALLRLLRPGLPVIIVTGFSDTELRARARRLGAVAVMDKPFSFGALQDTIEQVTVSIAAITPANTNDLT